MWTTFHQVHLPSVHVTQLWFFVSIKVHVGGGILQNFMAGCTKVTSGALSQCMLWVAAWDQLDLEWDVCACCWKLVSMMMHGAQTNPPKIRSGCTDLMSGAVFPCGICSYTRSGAPEVSLKHPDMKICEQHDTWCTDQCTKFHGWVHKSDVGCSKSVPAGSFDGETRICCQNA